MIYALPRCKYIFASITYVKKNLQNLDMSNTSFSLVTQQELHFLENIFFNFALFAGIVNSFSKFGVGLQQFSTPCQI